MYKTIFKTIVLLSSLQAVAQENQNDISENYFTENDTVKKLKEVVIEAKKTLQNLQLTELESKKKIYLKLFRLLVQKLSNNNNRFV